MPAISFNSATDTFGQMCGDLKSKNTQTKNKLSSDVLGFFAKTLFTRLVWPLAARLSMYIFIGKSVVPHLHEGPD